MTVEQPTPPSLSPPAEGAIQNPPPVQLQEKTSPQRRKRFGRVVLIVLILTVCGGAVWYWGIREPEPKDDLGRFQGDWKQTPDARNNKDGEAEAFPIAVHVTGDNWQYIVGGKGLKTFRITLNETASPKEIDLTLLNAEGKPIGEYGSHGIYTINRNEARIVVAPAYLPRPKGFDDPESIVWVLKRRAN
jgi:uncharacterized protein (TIGR03067 family)